MSHGLEIGLEDAQKTAIRNEVQKVQRKFLDTSVRAPGRVGKNGPAAPGGFWSTKRRYLAQVDRILALEKEIKKMQVSLPRAGSRTS